MAQMQETPTLKPGWKTTEFWGTVAVFALCAAMQSGAIGSGTQFETIAGLIGEVAAFLGYGGFRASVKKQFEQRR